MSAAYTTSEQQAYAAMQARLIDMLLRHDQTRFNELYEEYNQWAAENDAALQPYRDMAVLFLLRDELFEHILPQIVRRLSFELPRTIQIEEPPVQGRIDWERSLTATWQERPGEPPLQLHTRQRRRDFATPENLLTVATLLQYGSDIEWLLGSDVFISTALRHPLNDIIERCERELVFAQFAGLRSAAQSILAGANGGIEALEHSVAERVAQESSYGQLLQWRQRRNDLRLLQRSINEPFGTLGVDPQRDNKLYEFWIFYELVEFLQAQHALLELNPQDGARSIRFRWGTADQPCDYELRHDQSVAQPLSRWAWQAASKANVPGIRPDFYIQRITPAPASVIDNDTVYWREPGLVWDAKYYREQDTSGAPSGPVKKMLADLTLLGEPHGSLLFAFLDYNNQTEPAEPASLHIQPQHAQTTAGTAQIAVSQIRPGTDVATTHAMLRSLLDQAHERLRTPIVPRCEGIFLDALSIHSQARDRYGELLLTADGETSQSTQAREILLCPKRHIGPWRNDLVRRDLHCLQDASVCHIINQPGSTKPVRPLRDVEDLLSELDQIFNQREATNDLSEEEISAIAEQVQALTRQFAQMLGADKRMEVYYNRLRDIGLERTLDRLGPNERESMALAMFLVEQLDSVRASDYSAPAIHISGVMEIEIKRRVFNISNLQSQLRKSYKQTLGSLPYNQQNPHQSQGDWERIVQNAARHWNGAINPHDPAKIIGFEDFIKHTLQDIKQLRNQAAHSGPLTRQEYTRLQRLTCQSGPLGEGALNILLLAWN